MEQARSLFPYFFRSGDAKPPEQSLAMDLTDVYDQDGRIRQSSPEVRVPRPTSQASGVQSGRSHPESQHNTQERVTASSTWKLYRMRDARVSERQLQASHYQVGQPQGVSSDITPSGAHWKQEYDELSSSLSHSYELVKSLDKDIHGRNEEIAYHEQQKKALRRAYEQQFDKVKEQIEYYKQQNEVLKEELSDTKRQLESCRSALGNIQSRITQQPQGLWPQDEDKRVQQLIASFYKSVRAWSKKYAAPSFETFLTRTPGHQHVLVEGSKRVALNNMSSFTALKPPFLILTAFLSEGLRTHIFTIG